MRIVTPVILLALVLHHGGIAQASPLPPPAPRLVVQDPTRARSFRPLSPSIDRLEEHFTVEYLIKKIKARGRQGKCLFYGQREFANGSLSDDAKKYVCDREKCDENIRSIWNLWPSHSNDSSTPEADYYCLNIWQPRACWLEKWMTGMTREEWKDAVFRYYQRMSTAMARTCNDEVFVLLENVDKIDEPSPNPSVAPSIWRTHELPTLRCLFQQQIVTKLTAINNSTKARVDKTEALKSGDRANSCPS